MRQRRSRRRGEFERLLDYLKQSRGFDFSGYKRAEPDAPRPAPAWRCSACGGFDDYIDHLEVHPDEFARAVQHDPDQRHRRSSATRAAWDYLAREVRARACSSASAAGEPGARLVARAAPPARRPTPSPCCSPRRWARKRSASGSRSTPPTSTRRRSHCARQAPTPRRDWRRCSPRSCASATSSLSAARYVFRTDLRRAVIFGRHDLMQDAPISRLDLLVCRNTLMYFNAEAQARILGRFHFALNGDGKARHAVPRQGRDAAHARPAVRAARPQAPRVRQGGAAAAARAAPAGSG